MIEAVGPSTVSGTQGPDWMTAPGDTPMLGLGGDDVMISQGVKYYSLRNIKNNLMVAYCGDGYQSMRMSVWKK